MCSDGSFEEVIKKVLEEDDQIGESSSGAYGSPLWDFITCKRKTNPKTFAPKRSASAMSTALGFEWLRGTDAMRVKLANQCCETVSEVFKECVLHGVFTFIENPANSRMWDIPYIRELMKLPGVQFTVFHSCMHGGDRDKLTGILHNCPQLCSLALRCNGLHRHKSWSVSKSLTGQWKFDTSSEAEYIH